jgi:putative sulfotransferase
MTVDRASIFAELSEMLHAVSEELVPGEEISLETKLIEDLGLRSINIANLTGRVQSRFGTKATLVPFFASRPEGLFENLQVSEVIDYLETALNGDAPAPVSRLRDIRVVRGAGHTPADDNTGVLAELAPGVTRNLVELPAGQVEVFTAGTGPALVMMHPINVGAGVFAHLFAALAGRYRLVAAHNPGVGATTWDGELTLPALAQLHRAVLTELAITGPFHLLGSSFGGVVAQQFALDYPGDCTTLTLTGSSYQVGARRRGVRTLPEVAEREPAPKGPDSELLLRCESMATRFGVKYLSLFDAHPSLLGQLPDIEAPTLVLHGEKDTIVPVKRGQVLAGAIPRARLVPIEGAGHFPTLTHPVEVLAALGEFLAASNRPGRTSMRRLQGSADAAGGSFVPPAPPQTGTVIVGSGRCGSTMLSRLISAEEQTLSVSESMGHRLRAFLIRDADQVLSGEEYWAILSRPGRALGGEGRIMHKLGWYPAQFSYPDTGRYAGDRGTIPPILVITLPQLTDDPDALFDQLAGLVPSFPSQTALSHHKMLLNLLANLLGKLRWVERTGASSEIAEPLLRTFSDAKIVYLTRNIADTALSMSRHPSFQMTAVRDEFNARYGMDPFAPKAMARGKTLPDEADIPSDLRPLLPHRITLEALSEVGRNLPRFEILAAHMNGCAEQALADVQPANLYRVRYEDILANPVAELTRLGEYIGFEDPSGWAASVAGQVRTSSR